jgi:hypothetical protein
MKPALAAFLLCASVFFIPDGAYAELKVGAAIVDVTPPKRLAIVVVDSCMMPRPLLDEAKRLAAERTKIRPDRMLISATHSHSAPSSMGCLGTSADEAYVKFLPGKLAEAVAAAEGHLQPARVGWAVGNAAEFTALRRWIRRPDRVADDPFGNPTVRANMHAGRNWDDVTGESGPEDSDLSLISFQAKNGRPIAVLANFSMHYYGDQALSPDYFGLFRDGLQASLAGSSGGEHPAFVGIMSHGCSGDIWLRDYTQPASSQKTHTIESYTQGLLEITLRAYETITYCEDADLAMAEARIELKYRVPDKQRLEWARRIVDAMGSRDPETTEEVYAREQILLDEAKSAEIVVQALRIGDIGIATTPNETYALTGLKLKRQSPLEKTMIIELANGGDGYIPPPEQHLLGGYNTWPARSAGLEVEAEPKITQTALELLERVAGKPRRAFRQSRGPACEALLKTKPVAYWRLDEFAAPWAVDSAGRHHAVYEPGVVFFLEGPRSESFCTGGETNRAAHFAGGRVRSRIADLGNRYSISLWFWNGMPADARAVTGWMFSRGHDHGLGPHGDHLGVGGTAGGTGKLIFLHGDPDQGATPLVGCTEIERWTWNQAVLVRDGDTVRVYLNGKPEIEATSPASSPAAFDEWFFGGRCDGDSNWEGRLDEIAVFDRPLAPEEIRGLGCAQE